MHEITRDIRRAKPVAITLRQIEQFLRLVDEVAKQYGTPPAEAVMAFSEMGHLFVHESKTITLPAEEVVDI